MESWKTLAIKIANWGYYAVASLATILITLVSGLVIFKRVYIGPYEETWIQNNNLFIIISTIAIILVLLSLRNILAKIKPIYLFLSLSLVWLIVGVIYYLKAPSVVNPISYDQAIIWYGADQWAHGNYQSITQNLYFMKYPFQFGLLWFESIYQLITHNIYLVYFLNLLMVLAINYFTWQCTKLFLHNKAIVENYTLLLTFGFLPLLYFICFVYGNIPGFLAMFIAVYYGLRYLKDTDRYHYSWIGMIIFAVLAYIWKSNYLIPLIALACIYLWQALRQAKWKLVLISIALVLGMSVANTGLAAYYESHTGQAMSQGIPKVAWITMGLQSEDNVHHSGKAGWFNNYTEYLYETNHLDTAKTDKQAKKQLKKQVQFYIDHPKIGFQFFSKKLITTWSDPMFQSIFSGPNQKLYTNIYHDKTFNIYQLLIELMNILNIIITFAALCFIVGHFKRQNNYQMFIMLFFIGGFFFHFFWETKSQYMFQYMYCLIPLAGAMLAEWSMKLQQIIMQKASKD